MKQIRLIFALVALFAVGYGVYGTTIAPSVTYYRDTSAPGNCNEMIQLPCTEGDGAQCQIGGDNVWKSTDGSNCVEVFRQD